MASANSTGKSQEGTHSKNTPVDSTKTKKLADEYKANVMRTAGMSHEEWLIDDFNRQVARLMKEPRTPAEFRCVYTQEDSAIVEEYAKNEGFVVKRRLHEGPHVEKWLMYSDGTVRKEFERAGVHTTGVIMGYVTLTFSVE